MKTLAITTAAAALALTTGVASAATVYATEVLSVSQGAIDPAVQNNPNRPAFRDDPASALGAPDGEFYSLGLGGSIDLGFGQSFGGNNDVTTYEVTFSSDSPFESAQFFLLNEGLPTFQTATVTNRDSQNGQTFTFSGAFDGIRFTDTTLINDPDSQSPDGFDLDSVAVSDVSPVPLPAAGVLMLAGMGGFGALRARKKKAA